MTQPSGYRGPLDPGRDPAQVMSDPVAQNLIAEICQLHQDLCAKLDHNIDLAALGASEPASGYVTGSSDHDQTDGVLAAISQAERDATLGRKAAHSELRRVKAYYQERLGQRPPRRPPVQSIDYLDGNRQRRVG